MGAGYPPNPTKKSRQNLHAEEAEVVDNSAEETEEDEVVYNPAEEAEENENFQDTTGNSEFHHLIKVQKWLGTRLENFQNTNGTVSSKPSKVSKSFLQSLSES